jgi:hypothetical protein
MEQAGTNREAQGPGLMLLLLMPLKGWFAYASAVIGDADQEVLKVIA